MPTKVNHLHDFVRETSITTEEWMFAYVPPSPIYPCCSFLWCIGRLSIFWPRQGRYLLIFVKVLFRFVSCHKRGCLIFVPLSEFILLSDTLGVSTLVNALNSLTPLGATESTVLGPFYTDDAHDGKRKPDSHLIFFLTFFLISLPIPVENGDSIASEGKGDYMFVEGHVTDIRGNPIPNAVIDTWETDENGFYDTQVREVVILRCAGSI